MNRVTTGLEQLLGHPSRYLKGRRLGLVGNQTSVTADLTHAASALARLEGFELVRLFAPEHGFHGVAQDMEAVAPGTDPLTGLPVHSLYGDDAHTLTPDPGLFEDLDGLLFDIQDIGARYYTFIYTLANCMQAAGQAGVPVVVLDRPNPINGLQTEGNRVRPGYFSFVGQYPLLNRHGLTVGELARMFRDHFGIACDLTVVPMQGWNRAMWFDQTGLPWVPPSPNMPTLATATVYPGLCLIEGTRCSEGRGTTRPFEQAGAPGVDAVRLAETLNRLRLPGVRFRPVWFKPTFQKHAGRVCGGVFLHVTDRESFRPVLSGLAVICTLAAEFPDQFAWRTEPYEFVSDRPAIDLLYGHNGLREHLESGQEVLGREEPRMEDWVEDQQAFEKTRREFLLY